MRVCSMSLLRLSLFGLTVSFGGHALASPTQEAWPQEFQHSSTQTRIVPPAVQLRDIDDIWAELQAKERQKQKERAHKKVQELLKNQESLRAKL